MEQAFAAIPQIVNSLDDHVLADKALVLAAWRRAAGELLDRRTAALDHVDKTLIVAVQDQTWKRHLEALSGQLLFKINSTAGQGKVTFIEFKVDPGAIRDIDGQSSVGDDELPLPESLRSAALKITDSELRSKFLSAAAVYLDRQDGRKKDR